MEPLYNEVLGTMKITLLYQVSHYIRVKKQRNIKSWDQQNYLVIRGFCYIRPRYNEVPLYWQIWMNFHQSFEKCSHLTPGNQKITTNLFKRQIEGQQWTITRVSYTLMVPPPSRKSFYFANFSKYWRFQTTFIQHEAGGGGGGGGTHPTF